MAALAVHQARARGGRDLLWAGDPGLAASATTARQASMRPLLYSGQGGQCRLLSHLVWAASQNAPYSQLCPASATSPGCHMTPPPRPQPPHLKNVVGDVTTKLPFSLLTAWPGTPSNVHCTPPARASKKSEAERHQRAEVRKSGWTSVWSVCFLRATCAPSDMVSFMALCLLPGLVKT